MSALARYQLCAYVYESGEIARFDTFGWNTSGKILLHAPRSAQYIIVRGHSTIEVWDTMLPTYLGKVTDPPPVVEQYDDVDQALMATALKRK